MGQHAGDILEEGESCWRIAEADRAAVLIDVAAYYEALRSSLKKARRSIFIVGWDIDSRTRLVGPSGRADDGLPDELAPFLSALVARRPELRIHVLLWDYAMLYALDREPLPSINLAWKTPEQIEVCLDDVLPVGASHHQKIVVIDNAVAFCGGIDLTIRRWDTPAHDMKEPERVDPAGEPYRPFHDMQMVVDGAAASALGDLVRERWRDAACETPLETVPTGDPWPDDLDADFTNAKVGIARTIAAYDGRHEVREVEALIRRSIEAAERSIYIESQYLTADSVARALARRMGDNPRLEVLIVGPNVIKSWLEERSMTSGRRRFINALHEAGAGDRVRLLYPEVPDDDTGEGIMVHAKFMVVDDRFLRVGSANLNNRSMGVDTECDLALEATDDVDRRAIVRIRNRLLAEHLDCTPEEVERAVDGQGSLLGAVDRLSDGPRSLRPIEVRDVAADEITSTVAQLADPERPIAPPVISGDRFGATVAKPFPVQLLKLSIGAIAVLGLVAIWRYTPLAELAEPENLVQWLRRLDEDWWMPAVIPVVFVAGSLVVFPVTVLIAVTGMIFSPVTAFAYALGGALISALSTFLIGHWLGKGPLRSVAGPRVNRISRAMARRGILSVTAIRMVPIAPFTLINLVAGASHIRAADFFLGTVLGMAPGILVVTLLGRQLARALADPEPGHFVILGLGLAAWIAVCVGFQFVVSRLRSGDDD